jgi:hypothetical protein
MAESTLQLNSVGEGIVAGNIDRKARAVVMMSSRLRSAVWTVPVEDMYTDIQLEAEQSVADLIDVFSSADVIAAPYARCTLVATFSLSVWFELLT